MMKRSGIAHWPQASYTLALLVCCLVLATASVCKAQEFADYLHSFGEGALSQVQELAVPADGGSIVLSDRGQVRRYSLDGQVLDRLYWVRPVYYAFDPLVAVACAATGDVYLGDYLWCTLTRLDPQGNVVRVIGGRGSGPGQFLGLTYLVVAPDGMLYAADFGNNRVQRFTADLTFAGEWETPVGEGPPMLAGPDALAADAAGNIWVGWSDYAGLEGGSPWGLAVAYNPHGQEISRFPLETDASDPYVQDTTWLVRDMSFDVSGQLRILLDSSPERRELLSFDTQGNAGDPLALPWATDQFSVFPDGSFLISGWQTNVGAWVERITPSGDSLGRWGDQWWAADRSMLVWPACVGFDLQGRVLASGGFLWGDEHGQVFPAYSWLNRYTGEGALESVLYSEAYPEAMTWWFAVAPDGAVVSSESAIGIDRDGNRYVFTEPEYRHCIVTKTDPGGILLGQWDLGPSIVAIVVGMDGFFYAQRGIGVGIGGYGNMYQIERYDLQGRFLGLWEWFGLGALRAVDPGGRLYLTDKDRWGVHSAKLYSATGDLLGIIAAAGPEIFNSVSGIAITEDGLMVVSESQANRIHLFEITRSRFSDIPWWHWAKERIEAVAEAGIVAGYPSGAYCPSQPLTRDQMAVYISRALAGGDEAVPEGPSSPHFSDVPTHHWAYKYIEHAYSRGVVSGYPNGSYRPGDVVNRGQMAVFIARAMAGGDENVPEDADGQAFFPDVSPLHWVYRYVEYCHDQGVVGGYPDGRYRPGQLVDRAQMAVYVAKAFYLPM